MVTPTQSARRGCMTIFTVALAAALLVGALPAALTFVVDPYELFGDRERAGAISELAEKNHYPLWKLARYQPGAHDTVILGDSRARALRDKYWHESGLPGAVNLAYGGGTVPEIHATFSLIKRDPAVRNIIVGIQLRSMDEAHKGGMNRVPEAVRLIGEPTEYLKNWTVAKTALKVFQAQNAEAIERVRDYVPSLVSGAQAAQLGTAGRTSLETLLSPEICFSCVLPRGLDPLPFRRRYGRFDHLYLPGGRPHFGGLGWHMAYTAHLLDLYSVDVSERLLPAKIDRQVRRNGPADWRSFNFSASYWRMIEDMAEWAERTDRTLVFVIPPTITEMQATIHAHGLSALNFAFRAELAKLAPVVDLDFDNALTEDPANFSDAYHFRPNVSRAIVREVTHLVSGGANTPSTGKKRVVRMSCGDTQDREISIETSPITIANGENCRVWRRAL